ncbi:MAG: coenzyme F420-0:L-glutamate ligase [Dehalococcoidia bacterium]|jgi:coenzyme F420-0:L-glutamate ligase/coenzyme F420-1:gamma-L-glutamate ligase|nr:coenzyme F420-0:L-glutamate ligase [Dehalococcoidia bacterium]
MPTRIEIVAIAGLPEVRAGDDLAAMIFDATVDQGTLLEDGDVIVVAQKIVSKAEGEVVNMNTVIPSRRANELAETVKKDPRLVEIILQQSAQIVRAAPGVLITETVHGLVCANAGVDSSNSAADDQVILLPPDPDGSARILRAALESRTGVNVRVIVSDSFGRPWREGSTNVAIGIAGFEPLDDARGEVDDRGRLLRGTVVAVADELASAAQLAMGEFGGVPAAIVRGARLSSSDSADATALQRSTETDLFR